MSDYEERVQELLEEADGLTSWPSKVQLIEEAARLADTHRDVEAGFRTRQKLAEAATFAGEPDKLLVAFSWNLAQCDRDPHRFPESEMLWEYNWVLSDIIEFPQVSRAQIQTMFDDMRCRYQRAGASLHSFYQQQVISAVEMGDRAMARAAQSRLERTKPDELSYPPACTLHNLIYYLVFLGKDEEAVAKAQPILRGRLRCEEIPARTYGLVLLPLLRLGRPAEAMKYHEKGYRLVAGGPGFLHSVSYNLAFLTLTGNLTEAVSVFELHLPIALATTALYRRLEFYLAAQLFLREMVDRGQAKLRLRLPRKFRLPDGTVPCRAKDLAPWLGVELRALAQRFDSRNGNDYFSRRIENLPKLKEFAVNLPLKRKP